METLIPLLVYLLPLILVMWIYVWMQRRGSEKNRALMNEAVDAGLTEPVSLHPLIDAHKCVGCAACVKACPEKEVLGIIDGRAQLIGPANCIGHGACQIACPVNAISLVFGTETRGLDIPWISQEFETSVPGIYIAGELGGMGLIRNAVEQGKQALECVQKQLKKNTSMDFDVIIVGAGPAGIAASLAARSAGLKYRTLDQEASLGGTVAHFPRGKLVMTQPVTLPLAGVVKFRELSKEQLLNFWQDTLQQHPVEIDFSQRVEKIETLQNGFGVVTANSRYTTQKILLAIGRRGSPRTLGVIGEDHEKVVYRLIDPEQYRGKRVMVVGGGDSALEAACSLAELDEGPLTPSSPPLITLVYRGEVFNRAKARNRARVTALHQAGRLALRLGFNPQAIAADSVTLQSSSTLEIIPNDIVIVCAGGELPTAFLKKIGIRIETKYGTE